MSYWTGSTGVLWSPFWVIFKSVCVSSLVCLLTVSQFSLYQSKWLRQDSAASVYQVQVESMKSKLLWIGDLNRHNSHALRHNRYCNIATAQWPHVSDLLHAEPVRSVPVTLLAVSSLFQHYLFRKLNDILSLTQDILPYQGKCHNCMGFLLNHLSGSLLEFQSRSF